MSIAEKVLQCMRQDRKYSAGFIASRQGLSVPVVQQALHSLEYGMMVRCIKAEGNKRRKLYITNQMELPLFRSGATQ